MHEIFKKNTFAVIYIFRARSENKTESLNLRGFHMIQIFTIICYDLKFINYHYLQYKHG